MAVPALAAGVAVVAEARAHHAAALLATAEGLHVTLPGALALALRTPEQKLSNGVPQRWKRTLLQSQYRHFFCHACMSIVNRLVLLINTVTFVLHYPTRVGFFF